MWKQNLSLPLTAIALALLSSCRCLETRDSALDGLDTLFREIGFSPACVSHTLAFCENFSKSSSSVPKKSENCNFTWKTTLGQGDAQSTRNCAELLNLGDQKSGIRTVYPFSCCKNRPVSVFCDQTTDGGGWTLIQHREALPQRENFNRDWVEYQLGFGKLDQEFWLGLENIHALVSSTLMELRVDLEDFEGKKRWAKYDYFYIENADTQYRLHLGPYSGNAGDSLSYHRGQKFSTKDKDNDDHAKTSCSVAHRGAWWYKSCHHSNLNGHHYEGNHTSYADGINWKSFHEYHYSLKVSSLSIRPKI